ncbi:MAG TPA: PTS mannose/fructose/sorbose transporter subunit IIB [Erysipelotrichaceae bacterium]|nr:PTS mannose/fructose/sorbose transporter subunit IIB [Erysipelotrichaceae bacterium]
MKVFRIDYRLLHGQVAFAWVNHFNINAILVANDDVVSNEMRKSALRLAKPASSKLIFKSIQDSIDAINSGVTDKYNLLIVVENISDAKKLLLAISGIEEINLGLSMKKDGSTKLANAVYADSKEIEDLKEILNNNFKIYLQQSPTDKKEYIDINLLERV